MKPIDAHPLEAGENRPPRRTRAHTPVLLREIEQLRRAVRDRIEVDGLRPTARQVKQAATGLNKFAMGNSIPYRPTLRRLREWYTISVAAPREFYDAQDRDRAVDVLTVEMTEVAAANFRREVREIRQRFAAAPPAAERQLAA